MALGVRLCTSCLPLPKAREPKEKCHHVSAQVVLKTHVFSVSIHCSQMYLEQDRWGILETFCSFQVGHSILNDHGSPCGTTDRIHHCHYTNA